MAKRDKEYEARMQGMIYACNLAEKQGIEALKADIKMRGITGLPIQVSYEKASETLHEMAENMYTTFLTMTMIALEETYGFKKVRLMRLKESFDKHTRATYDMDWLGKHYVSLPSYVKFLKDECGVDLGEKALEIATENQRTADANHPEYKRVKLDRLVAELSDAGYEKAAEWLLKRFKDGEV